MENKEDNPGDNKPKRPLKDTTDKATSYVRYSGMAFQMLASIGLGVWAGLKLDEWQGNENPIWTVVLSLTSIGASLYLFIRQLPKEP